MSTNNRGPRNTPTSSAEASRRIIGSMQEATLASQELFEQYAVSAQRLFAASSAGWIAGMNAAVAVQNAAVTASLAMMDALRGNTALFREITAATGEAQQETLAAWKAGLRAIDTMVAGSRPN